MGERGWEASLLPLLRRVIAGDLLPPDAGWDASWRRAGGGFEWTPNQYWLNLAVRYALLDGEARAILLAELGADGQLHNVPRHLIEDSGLVEIPRDAEVSQRLLGIRPRPAEQSPHYEDYYCLADLAILVVARRRQDAIIQGLVEAKWGRRKALMQAFAARVAPPAAPERRVLRVIWCGNRASEPYSSTLDAWAWAAFGLAHDPWMYRDSRVAEHAGGRRNIGGGVWAVAAELLPAIPGGASTLASVRLPYPVERTLPWGPDHWSARIAPNDAPPPVSLGRVCRVTVRDGGVGWAREPGEPLKGETIFVGA